MQYTTSLSCPLYVSSSSWPMMDDMNNEDNLEENDVARDSIDDIDKYK